MILFTFRHFKQMYMTHIPLELQKQNMDILTLHEQANKMVYSLSLPCLSTDPINTCVFFLVACVILQIMFKFHFVSMHACVNKLGFR